MQVRVLSRSITFLDASLPATLGPLVFDAFDELYDVTYFLKGMTKTLLIVSVEDVLANPG